MLPDPEIANAELVHALFFPHGHGSAMIQRNAQARVVLAGGLVVIQNVINKTLSGNIGRVNFPVHQPDLPA